MPPGCSLITIETCGGAHKWDVSKGEIYEHKQLMKFIRNGGDLNIFKDPITNSNEINDIFGSISIYGTDDSYPNIEYSMVLKWPQKMSNVHDMRYSGLVPLEHFVNPDYTTTNIVHRLITTTGEAADPSKKKYPCLHEDLAVNDVWLQNQREIYKYSIFPSAGDLSRYFGSMGIEERSKLILDGNEFNEKKYQRALQQPDPLEEVDYLAKKQFNQTYIRVTLDTLFARFPGHYIHMVCRATSNTFNGWGYPNPNSEQNRTREELLRRRLRYMSQEKKRQLADYIQGSIVTKTPHPLISLSSKNISGNMLSTLQHSLAINELREGKIELRRGRRMTPIKNELVMGWENEPNTKTKTKTKTKRKRTNKSKNYNVKFRKSIRHTKSS